MTKNLQPHLLISKSTPFVLLPGDPGRVLRIKKFLKNPKQLAFNREYRTIVGTYKGVKITVTSTGIGGPSTAIAVHELVKSGAKYLIRIGSCGALQDFIKIGSLIIPNKVFKDDGTSKLFSKKLFVKPSKIVYDALIQSAKEQENIAFFSGINRSHDCFYLKNQKKISQEFSKKGFLSEEMEAATLLSMGEYLGVKTGVILNCVDVFSQKPEEGIKEYVLQNKESMLGEKKEIMVSLEALKKIARGEKK